MDITISPILFWTLFWIFVTYFENFIDFLIMLSKNKINIKAQLGWHLGFEFTLVLLMASQSIFKPIFKIAPSVVGFIIALVFIAIIEKIRTKYITKTPFLKIENKNE